MFAPQVLHGICSRHSTGTQQQVAPGTQGCTHSLLACVAPTPPPPPPPPAPQSQELCSLLHSSRHHQQLSITACLHGCRIVSGCPRRFRHVLSVVVGQGAACCAAGTGTVKDLVVPRVACPAVTDCNRVCEHPCYLPAAELTNHTHCSSQLGPRHDHHP